jgi:hypothetical protein
MKIRKADQVKDFEQIWDIFWKVIQTGDSFVFDKDTPREVLHTYWFAAHMESFVAIRVKQVFLFGKLLILIEG